MHVRGAECGLQCLGQQNAFYGILCDGQTLHWLVPAGKLAIHQWQFVSLLSHDVLWLAGDHLLSGLSPLAVWVFLIFVLLQVSLKPTFLCGARQVQSVFCYTVKPNIFVKWESCHQPSWLLFKKKTSLQNITFLTKDKITKISVLSCLQFCTPIMLNEKNHNTYFPLVGKFAFIQHHKAMAPTDPHVALVSAFVYSGNAYLERWTVQY